jgi:hypothetical protein
MNVVNAKLRQSYAEEKHALHACMQPLYHLTAAYCREIEREEERKKDDRSLIIPKPLEKCMFCKHAPFVSL